ncbi:MAG: heavy metal-associated domain-containing protein [Porphyromonadaceae bacterium]|nr:MAG: heavy metal-associated domain-containing protein [Porphyromonadaceae bacterium]
MDKVLDFGKEFYFLVSEMAPYLLFGFLFAGLLKAFFPTDGIVRFMGKNNFRSVWNAALLGVPLPLCSCGVIPTAVSFYRSGATKGATTSFLISTPQTGVDSMLATYSLLGLPFAIIRPIVALVTGLVGGVASHTFDKDQLSPADKDPDRGVIKEKSTFMQRMKTVVRYGFGELVEDIVKWLLIGLIAAALLSMLIPDSFFSRYIGNPWIEMLVVLAASVPLYICATGSIPLAAVLLMKGISPGAALVFLMAGPATNVATMMVISNTMGKKAFFIYLAAIVGGALFFGTVVNELLPASWFGMSHMESHEHLMGGTWVNALSTLFLFGLILVAIWNKWLKKLLLLNKSITMEQVKNPYFTTISVEGMTCNHCRTTVENNISAIKGVEEVTVDLQSGKVKIGGNDVNIDKIAARVKELGYQYKGTISR